MYNDGLVYGSIILAHAILYVISFFANLVGGQSFTTAVIKNTITPVWNETFEVRIFFFMNI